MPTSSDLVTDLPADFEVFGQAVDTSLADLKGGTTGQILAKNSNTNMDFVWATPASGGKVLQVVQTIKADTFTSSSTSPVDVTGFSVSITPSASNSTILLLVTVNGNGALNQTGAMFRLLRGSTDIVVPTSPGSRSSGFGSIFINDGAQIGSTGITYLDSPATTSATTYKIQGFAVSAGSFQVNRSSVDNNTSDYVRTVSSITAIEIGA